MHIPRLVCLGGLTLAAVPFAGTAAAASSLAAVVGDEVPMVIHVRDLSTLVENWRYTPLARMWSEPDVQRFFAPAIAGFSGDEVDSFVAQMKAETGFGPGEMLELFPGELIFALLEIPESRGGPDVEPRFALGAQVGENRSAIEALIERAQEQEESVAVTEEFQGETINVAVVADAEGGQREAMAWVFLDDVLWMANPKDALQEIVANAGKGGAASPLTAAPGFADVYRNEPNAQLAAYLNLGAVFDEAMAQLEREAAAAAAAEDEGGGPFPPLGLSPAAGFEALGLTSLRCLYAAATIDRPASTWTFGLKWNEQRGLLKLLAYGDAPAPRPSFASDAWYSVTASRYEFSRLFDVIKEVAVALNPGFGANIDQQVAGINASLGIDIERDLFGSLGDELLQAADIRDQPPGAATPYLVNQLLAVSLSNPDAFRLSLDALMAMVPPNFQQMIVPREYLGETIHTISPAGPEGGFNVSYAVARNQLLVGIGSASMVETVIQSLNGSGNSLWSLPDVSSALAELPAGSSAVSYVDIRRVVALGLEAIAAMGGGAELDEEQDGEAPQWVDPEAMPRPEVIEKYWSTAAGAVYREADGLRTVGRIRHVP